MYTTSQTEAIDLANKIQDFTDLLGVPRSNVNVGITDKLETRFGDHRVDRKRDRFIVLPVSDERASRLAEDFLTDPILCGFDGAPGGDTKGRFIYAYLRRPGTRP
jgi:hypothetical protein